MRMKEQLEDCGTPDDQDVVKGVVAFLFEKLPADFREKKHEDVWVSVSAVCAAARGGPQWVSAEAACSDGSPE